MLQEHFDHMAQRIWVFHSFSYYSPSRQFVICWLKIPFERHRVATSELRQFSFLYLDSAGNFSYNFRTLLSEMDSFKIRRRSPHHQWTTPVARIMVGSSASVQCRCDPREGFGTASEGIHFRNQFFGHILKLTTPQNGTGWNTTFSYYFQILGRLLYKLVLIHLKRSMDLPVAPESLIF